MRLRTVFFCGDQSPYGRAHLAPVLDAFDVAAVVIGTTARWATFRRALSGGEVNAKAHGVTTRIRRVINRYRRGYIDVPKVVRSRGVPLILADDVNAADALKQMRAFQPQLVISAAYPQIFGKEVLEVAPRGAVNFHPSLLPRFRGAHPHFWAIATGEPTSGVTAHFMTPRLDDGDVIAQRAFPVADLTYSQLYRRINDETPALVRDVSAFFADPDASARPQNDAHATLFRNDREIHRRIFWNLQPAAHVRNLCRTERAFCFFRGRPLTPLGASVLEGNRNLTNGVEVESGTVVDVSDDAGVIVKASDACVAVRDVAMNGRTVAAARWAKRQRLRIGERFE
jgi:methionyl-tRNA formyltransferase